MLIIFAGLPGVGKTTIARQLAKEIGAVYIRADTIEHALWEAEVKEIGVTGYLIGYRVAEENLRLGMNVVADTVNPWDVTRESWRDVAKEAGVAFLDVEVVCSDKKEHRRRVETREPDIEGFILPTWQCVRLREREYHPYTEDRLMIDTFTTTVEDAVKEIRSATERS